jgi:high-affinity iron transporter
VFQTFVLYLREGIEASLIVSILLAALRQLGQSHQARAVWAGVGLAVLGSLLGGVIVFATVREFTGPFEAVFEGLTLLAAVVVLTSVTFWMQTHSRTLKREITARATSAGSGFALALLGFTTVGRESVETTVFTLALAFQTQGALLLLLGAVLGLGAAIGLSVLIYRVGYRLDYRIFFRVMGILLIVFAAGLLSSGIHELQEAGWLPLLTAHIWSFEGHPVLGVNAPLGAMLHALLGYTDELSWLQALAYILYLAIAGMAFYRLTRKPPAPQAATAPQPEPAASTPA